MAKKTKKPKILFLYSLEDENYWKDGMWAALNLLEKDFDIYKFNLEALKITPDAEYPIHPDEADFVLGWGGFNSPADKYLRTIRGTKGLCVAGNAVSPRDIDVYDVLFYETEYYKPQISSHKNIVHAFGINSQIYKPVQMPKLWDFLSVGAFARWKRQWLICTKFGSKMALGQIQKGNLQESIEIVGNLIMGGCGVSGNVPPEDLVNFYNAARTVYVPAEVIGGGERVVLEARACGVNVEIEKDNPKLNELLTSPIWNETYYAAQLKQGILSCL